MMDSNLISYELSECILIANYDIRVNHLQQRKSSIPDLFVLGGTMTLAGVMITLKHERSIHQYEKVLDSIDKEKDALGKAVCNLNNLGYQFCLLLHRKSIVF